MVPVITTRGECSEALFQHGVNVFLCRLKDAEALALGIRTLMSSPDLRARLREGAAQLAREWFSWDNAMVRLMETIQKMPP
jgi:glycosyltransferase involved in cell wall biosynthesis